MHMRMNGPKKMIAEIKGQEGSMVEITGLIRKNDLVPDGVGIGARPGGRAQRHRRGKAERYRWSEPREGTPRADLVHLVLDQVLLGDPYYLLPVALGACTSMTMRMYADRNGWPLERVRVT